MGVRGLTTFIANRSRQYLESYELHDCYLVIDGNAIASQLYKWHCKCNDCFGGDYDKYANVITNFYQLLRDCGITPLVIFDGAYEKRKLKTVYSRMKNKISAAQKLNSVTQDSIPMFPLFLRELFSDITIKMEVKCMRCDFEGDSDAAYLARSLNCPLLSYDSDFYIFDVLYIPFSTMELRLKKKKHVKYISCDIYNVDKFLNSFGGLDKINLPLLAVLLGNDYVHRSSFSLFYKHLKIQKSKDNERQRMIKTVIVWLKNETPDSALRKILGRYKIHKRRKLAKKINMGIKGYQHSDSQILSYFDINLKSEEEKLITVPDPDEIEPIDEDDDEDEDEDQETSESGSEEENDTEQEEEREQELKHKQEEDKLEEEQEQEEEEQEVEWKPRNWYNLPSFFRDNYKKCLYPSCFMDLLVSRTYYCIPQVEDYSLEHSHTISLDILGAIYKILTFPTSRRLTCVSRNDNLGVRNLRLPPYKKYVPKLSIIESIDSNTRKEILLNILNIKYSETFNLFPSNWHLFLISLKYWVTNSKSKVTMSYIFSLILCGIVLNYVDNQVGFYRSTKSFQSKYRANNTNTKAQPIEKKNVESSDEINLDDSISCMQKLIQYFQMDAKMRTNSRLFDVNIVHHFAEFQSVLLHIKYLNAVLNLPFPSFIISDFYDGTFLYNMTTNLMKRTDLKSYMKILLDNCPTVLITFELMMEQIEAEIGSDLAQREVPRRRKKKKKSKTPVVSDDHMSIDTDSDEEAVLDPNNIYSLLSVVNK